MYVYIYIVCNSVLIGYRKRRSVNERGGTHY